MLFSESHGVIHLMQHVESSTAWYRESTLCGYSR